jgi:hypothetical protein
MKEYVLVEFIAEGSDDKIMLDGRLALLGDDFKRERELSYTTTTNPIYIVIGKISSIYASVVKLQDPFLSERMRISYIPDELKDRYRK